MIVSLTGFMGAGKSTVGARLATLLGYDFVDLDGYIEHKIGLSIPEIFASQGEETFRAVEVEALRDVVIMHRLTDTDLVIALGGGTIGIHDARRIILEETLCIYLKAGLPTLQERLKDGAGQRPMLQEDMESLLKEREKLYGMAPVCISTDTLSVEEVAGQIADIIKRKERTNE